MVAILTLCLYGPWILALLCFAFPTSTWLAADKQRWWWVAFLAIPVCGFFMTIPFLVGPLPALLRAKSRTQGHTTAPRDGGTIFSDD